MSRIAPSFGLAVVVSLIALLLFDFMGLIIKYLAPRYSAAELSTYRNFLGILPGIIVLYLSSAWHQNGRIMRIRQWPLAIARGLCITFAQFMFYIALGLMDFATAATIGYASALFTTAFAVPILGEKVGLVRWSAVMVGFAGVVMVMKPGTDAFTWIAVLPAGAAALYALTAVLARRVDDDVPSPLLNLYASLSAAVGSLILTLSTTGFTPIQSGEDALWLITMGVFGGTAALTLVIAYRMTEPSNLAPFSYFGIPLALLLGWIFFDEAPLDDILPGGILIVGAGLMIIWRERNLKKRRASEGLR